MKVAEATPLPNLEPTLWGLVGEFETPEQLAVAAAKVRAAGYTHFDAHSPFPIHGMERAMGIKMTSLPRSVFVGGFIGLCTGLAMQLWMNGIDYPWIISGKPLFSVPANIPITFELTVLFAAFTTFFGVLVANRLAEFHHPLLTSDRFRRVTQDRFFLSIEAVDPKYDAAETSDLLRAAGAINVEGLMAESEAKTALPRTFYGPISVIIALTFIPFAVAANARLSTSELPRIHIVPDMDNQEKYRPQAESKLFPDGRAMRPQVEGTVARGELLGGSQYHTGKIGEEFAAGFPLQVKLSTTTMARGQERFEIYCAPCHGIGGYGDGVVARRAEMLQEGTWVPPSSLHTENARNYSEGKLFDIITNGIRNMKPYRAQIPESDRWAIVLYIRALQRSQYARLEDVPEAARANLD